MPRKMTLTHRMDNLVNAAKAELKFTKENPIADHKNPSVPSRFLSDSRGHEKRVENLERICKELWMLRSDDDR